MKPSIIPFLVCFVISLVTNAQDPTGQYMRDFNLSKFVGTWEYRSDSIIFRIIFEERVRDYHVAKGDIVAGWHEFYKMDHLIESSMDSVYQSIQSATINGRTHKDPNVLHLSYNDKGRDRINDATLRLNPDNPNEAVWRLTLSEKMYINTKSPAWAKDLLPLNTYWIMHKVE